MTHDNKEKRYITIPVVAFEMLKAAGFILRYEQLCQSERSFRVAYQKAEEEYEEVFGETRYTDYNSFRRALNYHRKKSKKTNTI